MTVYAKKGAAHTCSSVVCVQSVEDEICAVLTKPTTDQLVAALQEEGVGEVVWTCRERDRIHDWAEGTPPHCWFRGTRGHHPECGLHLVVRIDGETS